MSSKLSKSDLKAIVKECLVEILKEGIMSPPSTSSTLNENKRSRRSSFDHVSWAKESHPEEKIDYSEHARSLTDNSILAEVLADSQNTLINQVNAEKMGKSAMSGDFAER